jgi:hypothetical protein
MKESKYLEFDKIESDSVKKFKEYLIHNKKSGECLGQIYYYSRWKQYIFEPKGNTIYSSDCLLDIATFIKELK